MLYDPIPEIRAIAAKALGSLVVGMGEEHFPTLESDLLAKCIDDRGLVSIDDTGSSSVERAGAAQGLAEVIVSLGIDRFRDMLPDIVAQVANAGGAGPADCGIREGILYIFVYMPQACENPQDFEPFVADVLSPVLQGLADESEEVRSVALSAAKVLIELYAKSALWLLLPPLEERLHDVNWRIRHSAVQLLGDLLFALTGTSGKSITEDDEEGFATGSTTKALIEAVGEEKRLDLLAALYFVKQDTAVVVGQSATHVWKTIVVNTPKTLRDITPALMALCVRYLADENEEMREMASASLGDVVQKLGERVLPDIVPILHNGLIDDDAGKRQGICLGLAAVLAAASKVELAPLVGDFIDPISRAVCDSDASVRAAAATAFATLYRTQEFGRAALDLILPQLLSTLGESTDPDELESALDGLRQMVTARPQLTPHLVPKLLGKVDPNTSTMSLATARSIAALSAVPGVRLYEYVTQVMGPLMSAIAAAKTDGSSDASELQSLAETIALAVADSDDGDGLALDTIMTEVIRLAETKGAESAVIRASAAELLASLFKSGTELEDFANDAADALLRLLDDASPDCRLTGWAGMKAIVAALPKENLPKLNHVVYSAVCRLRESGRRSDSEWTLKGFDVPKGLSAVLPIFQQGLMHGSAETREAAAVGIGELIDVTSTKFLKPFVIPITGPLIRIVGDRFPWEVKAAILQTFTQLIAKAGKMLKPFLPQLQTTFVKLLQHNTKVVREQSAAALGSLMTLQTRVDPLVSDLTATCAKGLALDVEDPAAVLASVLLALDKVLGSAGPKVSEAALEKVAPVALDNITVSESGVRLAAAGAVAQCLKLLPEDSRDELIEDVVLGEAAEWTERHGSLATIGELFECCNELLAPHRADFAAAIKAGLKDMETELRTVAVQAMGSCALAGLRVGENDDMTVAMLKQTCDLAMDGNLEVRLQALLSVRSIAAERAEDLSVHLGAIVPSLLKACKERNHQVRYSAEVALGTVLQVVEMGPAMTEDFARSCGDAEVSKAVRAAQSKILKACTEDAR